MFFGPPGGDAPDDVDPAAAAAACSAAAAEMKKVCGGDSYAEIAEALDAGKITEVGGGTAVQT